jgi:flagellar biosynthetic protein FliR
MGVIVSVNQIIIGLALGFMVKIVFSALETGGHLIGQTMGLGFAQMNDPVNGITVPVISQFYTIMATLIFLIMNGHLAMIEVLIESFSILPVGINGLGPDGIWQIVKWSSWIFSGAIAISLPAVGALLLVNISFGVMMRAAPQLNIFTIGFPISLMLGFVFIMFSLPVFSTQFLYMLDNTILEATNILK